VIVEKTMNPIYADDMTMRAARELYFETNGFGADGGYNDTWVDFKLGPVPMPFPNTPGRLKAVKFHDLHHVLTGYQTNTLGEFEISAWEIGAGCKKIAAAWVLNLGGMVGGLSSTPRRTFAAFVRGRQSRTLYSDDYEQLLERRVGELRGRYIGESQGRTRASDVALFAGALVAGLAVWAVVLPLVLLLMPLGLVAAWLRRRQEQNSAVA